MSALWAPGQKQLADRLGFTGNDAKSTAAIMSALLIVWWGPTGKNEIEEATEEKVSSEVSPISFFNRPIWDPLFSKNRHRKGRYSSSHGRDKEYT